MANPDSISEAIDSLRHDEGCSAGIDPKYRCRCNVEELRTAARARLAEVRDLHKEISESLARDAAIRKIGKDCRSLLVPDEWIITRQWIELCLPPNERDALKAALTPENEKTDG